jgi:hypothetical protein
MTCPLANSTSGMAGYSPLTALCDSDAAAFVPCPFLCCRQEMIDPFSTIATFFLVDGHFAGSQDLITGLVAGCTNLSSCFCRNKTLIRAPAIATCILSFWHLKFQVFFASWDFFRAACNQHWWRAPHSSSLFAALRVRVPGKY